MSDVSTTARLEDIGTVFESVSEESVDTGETVPMPITPERFEETVINGRNVRIAYFADGTSRIEDLGAANQPDDTATTQQRENAFAIINTFLQRAGLAGLEQNVRSLLSEGITDTDVILYRLRDTDQFKRRFSANEARRASNMPELSPGEYIGMEQAYQSLLRANGLPVKFYDQPSDFQKWLEGDVSLTELQTRIEQGFNRARNADPAVRQQLERLYGVTEGEMAAYFLDPERTRTLLASDYARQVQASEIAARGAEQGGLQLTQAQAEELARRGITGEEAQRQFMQRGLLEGLYQPLYGEQKLSAEEEIGAIFEYDPEAQKRLQQRRAQRVGEFQAGGQFARTTGATSGTVETGVGTAQ